MLYSESLFLKLLTYYLNIHPSTYKIENINPSNKMKKEDFRLLVICLRMTLFYTVII